MQKIASICASVSNRGRNCFASRSQKKSKRRGTTNKTKLQWRRGGQWERRKTNCRSCTQCCHLADVESWKNGRNDWYTNIYCILNSNKFFLICYNNYNFHKIAGVFLHLQRDLYLICLCNYLNCQYYKKLQNYFYRPPHKKNMTKILSDENDAFIYNDLPTTLFIWRCHSY